MILDQTDLFSSEILPVPDALQFFAESNRESRGEVFTRSEIVEFILDLVEWPKSRLEKPLRLLEPSCGTGDFLIPAIEHFVSDLKKIDINQIASTFVAVEVNRSAFETCQTRVIDLLRSFDVSTEDAKWLAKQWVVHADFLTLSLDPNFTHVIGNPPYLRQEALPKELLQIYRERFSTMYDRADLYVPFFEKSLKLLVPEGKHVFICSDRWMKNKYGGPLREMVSSQFHLDAYVDFTGADAFQNDVVAYPAVTMIRRGKGTQTLSSSRPKISNDHLTKLATSLRAQGNNNSVVAIENASNGKDPWLLDNLPLVSEIKKLESQFPSIEKTGCKVGIGVATGADKIYIGSREELDIEEALLLPILTTRDVEDGEIHWKNRYIFNPFKNGSTQLVDPEQFPKLKSFLEKHAEPLQRRHVAKKNPNAWFKTIDRIYDDLTHTPKLLIPDIKGKPEVVLDFGEYYPHHNFYFVTTTEWDIHALQGVLRSPLAKAFVSTYSLKMRGDFLRFQAQYLRRICLPQWNEVDQSLRNALIKASKEKDQNKANKLVRKIFGLSLESWKLFETV